MAGYAAGGLLVGTFPIRPLVAALGFAGLVVIAVLVWPMVRTVRRERALAVGSAADRASGAPAAHSR